MMIEENAPLMHTGELHLIPTTKIDTAVNHLASELELAAASTDGFDLYRVVSCYFTDLAMRAEMNHLLGIDDADQNAWYW